MLGREDLPHTIVASKHLSGESRFILRSELMILLLTMCGKGLKEELLRHEVTPVCTLNPSRLFHHPRFEKVINREL